MSEMIQVRSMKDYFKTYGVDAIGKKKADPVMVKNQLVDAFRNEVFGLISFRLGDTFSLEQNDIWALDKVRNIVKDTTRKWCALCREFDKYRETHGVIKPEDLKFINDDDTDTDGDTENEEDFCINDAHSTEQETRT